jgi:hypothetical protein
MRKSSKVFCCELLYESHAEVKMSEQEKNECLWKGFTIVSPAGNEEIQEEYNPIQPV